MVPAVVSGRIVSAMCGPKATGRERAGHVGFVYPTVQFRDDTVMAFVGAGLKLGERVVLASEDQRWESALAQHGVDSRRAAEDGSLTILDAPRFFPAQGQAALVDSLVGSDGTRVRLVTSAEGALAYLGGSGFRRVEREMDDLCETRPVRLLCHLRSGTGRGEPLSPTLDTFVDTHADELRCRLVTMHRVAGGVRLRGEVDVANCGLVETVLARAAEDNGAAGHPGHDATVVVDLSELDFLGATGYHALRRGTERWRAGGGTVLLTGASVAVRRVLELVGLGADGDVRLA